MPFVFLGTVMSKLTEHIPFLCMVAPTASDKIQLNLNRIIESVVIAVVIAGVLGWAFKPELNHIKEDIAELKGQVGKIYNDIYAPILKDDH